MGKVHGSLARAGKVRLRRASKRRVAREGEEEARWTIDGGCAIRGLGLAAGRIRGRWRRARWVEGTMKTRSKGARWVWGGFTRVFVRAGRRAGRRAGVRGRIGR